MKILVIEDEKELSGSIRDYLAKDGSRCEAAFSFYEAEEKLALYTYDCVLVDITLPGGNGLDLLQKLRNEHPETGIIIISARNALDDKLKSFGLGADDYLAKPFHLSELNARLRSVLRRNQFHGKNVITFEEITLNPEEKTVRVNEEEIILTKKEFDLLQYLLTSNNRVLTKSAIAEHLWGDEMDMADSYDFIYSHIKNLRKKIIEKGGGDYIQTVYGMGYRLGKG